MAETYRFLSITISISCYNAYPGVAREYFGGPSYEGHVQSLYTIT